MDVGADRLEEVLLEPRVVRTALRHRLPYDDERLANGFEALSGSRRVADHVLAAERAALPEERLRPRVVVLGATLAECAAAAEGVDDALVRVTALVLTSPEFQLV